MGVSHKFSDMDVTVGSQDCVSALLCKDVDSREGEVDIFNFIFKFKPFSLKLT